jgi:hypothetical protein
VHVMQWQARIGEVSIPGDVQHDASSNRDSCKLHKGLAEFGAAVGSRLEKLGDDCYRSNIQECSGRKGEQEVSPCKAGAPQTTSDAHKVVITMVATKLLNGNANQRTQEGTKSRDELSALGTQYVSHSQSLVSPFQAMTLPQGRRPAVYMARRYDQR